MSSYKHDTGTFIGKGSIEIFFQNWIVSSPKAVLIAVHGLAEHSGRYENLINALDGSGISIYALDHRGFGRSGGKKGHVDSFSDYIYDLKLFVDLVKEQNRGVPLLMLGHSLGGVISCRYALEYGDDLNGLVLSSAGFVLSTEIPAWKKAAASFLSSSMPQFTMSNGLSSSGLSHDRDVIEAYDNDPMVHDRVSARFFSEFTKASAECLSRSFELTLPVLLIHGKTDPIVDYKGSEMVFERASSSDKELHIFDGLYHETMNEVPEERKKVLAVVTAWIKKHATGKKAALKKAAPKKAAPKKAAPKKAAPKKAAPKKAAPKKAAPKKAAPKKAAPKKAAPKKAAPKKAAPKKAAPKKAAPKKAAPKKAAPKKAAPKKTAPKKTAPAKKTSSSKKKAGTRKK